MSDAEKVLVVGLGHVGQPLAVKLVEAGFVVYGIDTNHRVVKSIQTGTSHVGSQEAVI